jgi:Holliday junction resolvasome RuvABC endonuclease subunit
MPVILGLDPGLAATGWAIGVKRQGMLCVTAAGVCRTSIDRAAERAGDDNMRRVGELFVELRNTCDLFSVQAIATEGISVVVPKGGRPQPMMAIRQGLVFGVVAAVAGNLGVPLIQVYPQRLKKRVAGNPKASKEEVIAAVRAAFPDLVWPKQKTLHEHQADAVGAIMATVNEPEIVALDVERDNLAFRDHIDNLSKAQIDQAIEKRSS